ncbi:hypothetical protein ACO0SA_000490 [Hanseniaspora valbyensis]
MIITHKVEKRLKSIFKYRSINVSLLTFLTVGFVIFYIFGAEREDLNSLANASPELQSLVDYSWDQLQIITEKPHPYGSHNNIKVHDHLVDEINSIIESSTNSNIVLDTKPQNLLFKQQDVFDPESKSTRVISYESNNILVKLEGVNPKLPGLVIANHFDSVPLGRGKNDANTGTVTLLAILKHLIDKPLTRDIVFNFNNNEEFGLLGATSFMKHPWLKNVKFFLNLEGVSGGSNAGKPILFRTSNVQTAKLYKEAVPPKLTFGNSIFQYGFLSRWLSSETDFKIYDDSLFGWDISFFKNRRFYHTLFDATKYDNKFGVFSMLQVCLNLVDYMSGSEDLIDPEQGNKAVYFDFLGKFHVFDSKKFNQLNIVLLILFPVLISVSWNINGLCLSWIHWAKPAITLIVSGYAINLSVNLLLNKLNPMFISRSFYIPLLALLAEFILLNIIMTRVLLNSCYRFKTIATFEITIGLWILLVSKTFKNIESDYKGTYIYALTIVYSVFSISSIMGVLFDPVLKEKKTPQSEEEIGSDNDYNNAGEREVLVDVSNEDPNYNSVEHQNGNETSDDITTNNNNINNNNNNNHDDSIERDDYLADREDEEYMENLKKPIFANWWLQYLLTVPFLTLFMTYSSSLVLTALHQSVTESFKSLHQVSTILLYSCFLIALPIIPFVPKLNHYWIILISAVFLIASTCSLNLDPFTEQTPIKIRVAEYWDLNSKKPKNHMKATSIDLTSYYKDKKQLLLPNMLEDLPSQKPDTTVTCETSPSGAQSCEWVLPFINSTTKENTFFDIEVIKNTRLDEDRTIYEPLKASFKIANIENRVCTLYFPKKNSIKQIKTNGLSWIKPLEYGVDELQLHKLDFKKEFEVELTWIPKLLLDSDGFDSVHDDELEVDVKCYFGDLTVDNVYQSDGIHELIEYANTNFVISNLEKGVIVSEKTIIL